MSEIIANNTKYVFIGYWSACEALRRNGTGFSLWPDTPRLLPTRGACVVGQRDLARIARAEGFDKLGIVGRPVDILVPNGQFRRRGQQARTHSWSNLLPPHCMLRMRDQVLVSTPEFTVLQLANTFMRFDASLERTVKRILEEEEVRGRLGIEEKAPVEDFRVWDRIAAKVRVARVIMEFAGTYRLPVSPAEETRYKVAPLTSVAQIREFANAIPPTNTYKHSTAFKSLNDLLPWVVEGSRSPMETSVALMLSMPVARGGYGLPKPQLNKTPERFGEHEVEADLLWEDARLVVEYDSKEFHASKGADKIDADIMRANAMRAMGYTVLEVTPGIAMDRYRFDTLARQIAGLLSVELAPVDHTGVFLRSMLHAELFGVEWA